MKNKLQKGLLFGLCVLVLLVGLAPAAAAKRDPIDEAKCLIDGIVCYNLAESGTETVQDWIDTSFGEGIGITSEWYALALFQTGSYDFSAYARALEAYLAEHTVSSASSRLKFALTLAAIAPDSSYVAQTLADSVGKQGVMSWIFALHLANNGIECAEYPAENILETLLSLQLADGGWALRGEVGDVDVTAMALQALAPHMDSDDAVKPACSAALAMLSARQTENGGFISYGIENPESAAQVATALAALGIDCETDPRFQKNGVTILQNIATFRLPDGSFCHQLGGASNANATLQVFCAMTAYLRMSGGLSSFYLFSGPIPPAPPVSTTLPQTGVPTTPAITTVPVATAPQTTVATTPATTALPTTTTAASESSGNYKLWATAAIAALTLILVLVLILAKKRQPKNLIALAVAAAVAILVVWVTDFRSTDEYYGHAPTKENAVGTVTITIRCDTVAQMGDPAYVPADGVILPETIYAIAEGDTVFTILTEAAREHGIQLEYSGTARLAYVTGIHYLYEFGFGDLSGWVYRVNGERPSAGCGEYVLSNGDTIEWLYSLELGEDLE